MAESVTLENLDEIFTYHPPNDHQRVAYERIRAAAWEMAGVILENTIPCADQQEALRKLRESVMTANAAVALKGLI